MKTSSGTKNLASNVGDKAVKTSETIAEGGKSAINTTVETTGKVAHSVWDGTKGAASTIAESTKNAASNVADGTKNLAAAGVEKTENAWQGIARRKSKFRLIALHFGSFKSSFSANMKNINVKTRLKYLSPNSLMAFEIAKIIER